LSSLLRRSAGAFVVVALAAGSAACTHQAKPAASGSPSPSASAVPSIPLSIRVTRVSGKLSAAKTSSLQSSVGTALDRYFDEAYLGGTYPRTDFSSALSQFPANLATQARHDTTLLTNAALGGSTQSVTAKVKTAYLSVLAPHNKPAGVSARINLVYLDNRGDQPAREVTVSGRLMLTPTKSGSWRIFGYSISRSTQSVKGS
jgi:hypothetical protein